MTEPTDDEIMELAKPFITRVGSHWENDDAIPDNGRIEEFARAVLAKWGTPPAVVGELVGWVWQHDETGRTGFVDCWQVENGWQENNPRLRLVSELYTTPQPTQAQAGAVPLTNEQCDAIYEALDFFGREVCHYEYGLPYCTSDGETLAKTEAREVIRQAAHGIKGGQHGNSTT